MQTVAAPTVTTVTGTTATGYQVTGTAEPNVTIEIHNEAGLVIATERLMVLAHLQSLFRRAQQQLTKP